MKLKMLKYCQRKINGNLIILDVNKTINIENVDEAEQLITDGFALKVGDVAATNEGAAGSFENKMIDIIYKKRGRPRKEA